MKYRTALVVLPLASLSGAAWAQCSLQAQAQRSGTANIVTASNMHAAENIVETAKAAGSFGTLLAAAQAAGLVDALSGPGPFTLFAPTDEAFAKLPKGTVESLLKPENRDKLAAILKYHVVTGELSAREVSRLGGASTLNGQRLTFTAENHAVAIDSAHVVKADILCSNGVIHVIDSVMIPEQRNIVEVAAGAKTFGTLLAAAKAAGLADALMGDGPLTVFAPTDEAFAKLPKGTVESLLKPENRDKLAAILKYHVVKGRVDAGAAAGAGTATTLGGGALRIDIEDGRLCVEGAKIVASDVDASNGVIHVIDSVLLPG
ncbi:MAG: fasciclin domain-containing protein [Phycisphaerales bacterium]|nr:fasciclin domain-containing protein [Phycisphaerales bacterium]